MKLVKLDYRALLLALVASFVGEVQALPIGTAFTYQGVLDRAGQPANGSYDLRFALFDASSGGSQVGSPATNAPVIVTNGNFTVLLDFGAVFNGDARWLEVGVRTNGASSSYTTLSPRQPLTPSPYAVYAPSAGLAATATAAATATNLAGNLSGDVTGTQMATVVARVGGQAAADVANGSVTANAATSTNTPGRIVKRDAVGNFSAGTITAGAFSGNGASLTNLNAGALASGTVPSACLTGTYSGALIFSNSSNRFSGNGAGLTNLNAGALASGTVPSACLTGTYSGALTFSNSSNRFTGDGLGLTNAGLAGTTVLNVNNCSGSSVSYSTAFTKVADIGTFNKLLAASTIEATFNGRTYVAGMSFGSPGAIFELRVDNTATLNGRARASYRSSEAANTAGVQTSITGIFTRLAAGSHTVSMWIQGAGPNASGAGAQLDPGCWSTDYVVVKELK